MGTSFLTPNMNLTVPVPGQEPGPNWANDLNNSLAVIDAHNHSPGSGVQINPAGININSDLTWNNSYNAIALRSVRFFPQVTPISASPPDLGCLYESGVDLYYNDGSGNQIRITQSGSVSGASGTITGLPSGTASAAYNSGSGTFIFQQATSTAANLDVASVAIRYPGSYPTPTGNYVQLQAPSSLASGYSITLPALPGSTSLVSLSSAGILSASALTITQLRAALQAPTVQVFLSGSGTYTTPSPAPLYIRVTLCGGGAGGSASTAGGGGSAGGTGGTTTFGSSLLTATGGLGGNITSGGAGGEGGTFTVGAGAIDVGSVNGGAGGGAGFTSTTNDAKPGGNGGSNPLGGAGAGAGAAEIDSGQTGAPNSGAGGGGGGANGGANRAGPGGGSGGYVDAIITSLAGTYAYSVGTAGAADTTNQNNAAAGSAGRITVIEYYQ